MALGVGFLEVGDGQAGVGAERVERGVAEQFLDVVDIGAGTDQLRRAAPPEGVGRDTHIHPRALGAVVHVHQEPPVAHPRPFLRQEQRPLRVVPHQVRPLL